MVAKDDTVLAPAALGDLDFGLLVEQLDLDPRVKVEARLTPRTFSAQSLGTSITDEVVVATMSEDAAADLSLHPQVILEEDSLVIPTPAVTPDANPDPGLLSPFGESTSWTIVLSGAGQQPVPDAAVYLYGSGVPVQGRTDSAGSVTLSLVGETDATLRALYVNPQTDYWSLWVDRPQLVSGTSNTVQLTPLADSFPGFPKTELVGWGQRAMRLDMVPPALNGAGVKVAVVDSGAAAQTHPDLLAIHDGADFTSTPSDSGRWREDTIAHGSHCSGIIAGARNGGGIRGFAPDALMYEARIFPGGRISSLIDAVDYCIEEGIDVINMSLGTGGSSQILLQKLAQAKELGIACVVAAGNTGGDVQFPGTSPDVLTVAAIGQDGQFPADSYHAQQRWKQGQTDRTYFSAQFSCHGDEVDVCGPGVAIVSSVPTTGFAAWDGTSMATPHVTGLCALVLAHHADFQSGAFTARNAARVDRLFELVRSTATPLQFGDGRRAGAGLPDALRALGLGGAVPSGAGQQLGALAITTALAQLRQVLISAGLLVEAASVAPPSAPGLDRHLAEVKIKRELSELQARMANAGLRVLADSAG
jgi:subtilisin